MVELYEGDCLEIMPTLPDGCADMILADLPYGTTACKWDSVIPFEPLWEQYKRLIKPNGAIVLFGSQPFTSALVMSNPTWFRYCWVWNKSKAPDFVNAKNKPLRNHEDIAVFSAAGTANGARLKMRYFPQGVTPVLRHVTAGESKFGSIAGKRPSHKPEYMTEGTNYPMTTLYYPNEGDTLHPTQKPVALLAYLIRTYTNAGETVLDNTMGSGSTGAACIEEGRRFIGIEKDAAYFQIAKERLEREQTKPRTLRMEMPV